MRLSIMQPYFIPYAGYFRLFVDTDVFVLYDCVQFPTRTWVHRNQFFLKADQRYQWLTLPLQKAPRETKIKDILFSPTAESDLMARLRKIPFLTESFRDHQTLSSLYESFKIPTTYLVDYLHHLLQQFCSLLSLPCTIIRSSILPINPLAKGQDRILEICEYMGATTYINAPNGRSLYDHDTFKHRNIDLTFLSFYKGSMVSILQRLLEEEAKVVSRDICQQTQYIL